MESNYLKAAKLDSEQWCGEMIQAEPQQYDHFYASVFLLTLLPNVQDLTLHPQWEDFDHPPSKLARGEDEKPNTLWDLLDAIVLTANGNDTAVCALGKLARIHPFMDFGYDERAGLQMLNPFMALPSMREIHASSCVAVDDGYTGKPFEWRYESIDSKVEVMELANSCATGFELSQCLKHMPHLRSFKFSYHTKWHGCGHDWDAYEFVEAPADSCGNTLAELSISVDDVFGAFKGGVSSFKRLKHLKDLHFDIRLILGPPVAGELCDMDPEEYGRHTRYKETSTVPHPLDLLPRSVEKLRMSAKVTRLDHVGNGLKLDYRRTTGLQNMLVKLAEPSVARSTQLVEVSACREDVNHDEIKWKSIREGLISAGYKYTESLPSGDNEGF